MTVEKLITDHIDIWSSTWQTRSTAGRGSNGKIDLYGVKKLRELILELAVRGKLVPQDPNDEPASELLKRIAAEKAELVKQGKIKKQKSLPEISEDEKPFELPEGWEWTRLSDISAYIQRGKGPKYAEHGSVKVVSQKCVQWSGFKLEQSRWITDESIHSYTEERFLKDGDVLWNSTGAGGTAGRVIYLPVVKGKLVVDSHITLIRTVRDNGQFISNYISTYGIQQRFDPKHSNTLLSGTTNQAELNTSVVTSFLVPFPPQKEQERINDKAAELMSLCDQLEQQSLISLDAHQQLVETLLATLTDSQNAEELTKNWARISQHFDSLFTTEASIDALKQTILQLAVMGKLVPQFGGDTPVKETYETIFRIKEKLIKEKVYQKSSVLKPKSSKLSIPENWLHTQFGEVCCSIVPNRDKPKTFSGNIPWITLPSFDECNVYINESGSEIGLTPEEIKAFNARVIPAGSVLMSCIGRFGLTMINKCEVVINQQIHAFIPLGGVVAEYLSFVIKASKKSLEESSTSTTIAYLNKSNCESIEFGLPPLEEQKRIVDKVNELTAMCNLVKSRLQSAQQTQLHLADALTEAALN